MGKKDNKCFITVENLPSNIDKNELLGEIRGSIRDAGLSDDISKIKCVFQNNDEPKYILHKDNMTFVSSDIEKVLGAYSNSDSPIFSEFAKVSVDFDANRNGMILTSDDNSRKFVNAAIFTELQKPEYEDFTKVDFVDSNRFEISNDEIKMDVRVFGSDFSVSSFTEKYENVEVNATFKKGDDKTPDSYSMSERVDVGDGSSFVIRTTSTELEFSKDIPKFSDFVRGEFAISENPSLALEVRREDVSANIYFDIPDTGYHSAVSIIDNSTVSFDGDKLQVSTTIDTDNGEKTFTLSDTVSQIARDEDKVSVTVKYSETEDKFSVSTVSKSEDYRVRRDFSNDGSTLDKIEISGKGEKTHIDVYEDKCSISRNMEVDGTSARVTWTEDRANLDVSGNISDITSKIETSVDSISDREDFRTSFTEVRDVESTLRENFDGTPRSTIFVREDSCSAVTRQSSDGESTTVKYDKECRPSQVEHTYTTNDSSDSKTTIVYSDRREHNISSMVGEIDKIKTSATEASIDLSDKRIEVSEKTVAIADDVVKSFEISRTDGEIGEDIKGLITTYDSFVETLSPDSDKILGAISSDSLGEAYVRVEKTEDSDKTTITFRDGIDKDTLLSKDSESEDKSSSDNEFLAEKINDSETVRGITITETDGKEDIRIDFVANEDRYSRIYDSESGEFKEGAAFIKTGEYEFKEPSFDTSKVDNFDKIIENSDKLEGNVVTQIGCRDGEYSAYSIVKYDDYRVGVSYNENGDISRLGTTFENGDKTDITFRNPDAVSPDARMEFCDRIKDFANEKISFGADSITVLDKRDSVDVRITMSCSDISPDAIDKANSKIAEIYETADKVDVSSSDKADIPYIVLAESDKSDVSQISISALSGGEASEIRVDFKPDTHLELSDGSPFAEKVGAGESIQSLYWNGDKDTTIVTLGDSDFKYSRQFDNETNEFVSGNAYIEKDGEVLFSSIGDSSPEIDNAHDAMSKYEKFAEGIETRYTTLDIDSRENKFAETRFVGEDKDVSIKCSQDRDTGEFNVEKVDTRFDVISEDNKTSYAYVSLDSSILNHDGSTTESSREFLNHVDNNREDFGDKNVSISSTSVSLREKESSVGRVTISYDGTSNIETKLEELKERRDEIIDAIESRKENPSDSEFQGKIDILSEFNEDSLKYVNIELGSDNSTGELRLVDNENFDFDIRFGEGFTASDISGDNSFLSNIVDGDAEIRGISVFGSSNGDVISVDTKSEVNGRFDTREHYVDTGDFIKGLNFVESDSSDYKFCKVETFAFNSSDGEKCALVIVRGYDEDNKSHIVEKGIISLDGTDKEAGKDIETKIDEFLADVSSGDTDKYEFEKGYENSDPKSFAGLIEALQKDYDGNDGGIGEHYDDINNKITETINEIADLRSQLIEAYASPDSTMGDINNIRAEIKGKESELNVFKDMISTSPDRKDFRGISAIENYKANASELAAVKSALKDTPKDSPKYQELQTRICELRQEGGNPLFTSSCDNILGEMIAKSLIDKCTTVKGAEIVKAFFCQNYLDIPRLINALSMPDTELRERTPDNTPDGGPDGGPDTPNAAVSEGEVFPTNEDGDITPDSIDADNNIDIKEKEEEIKSEGKVEQSEEEEKEKEEKKEKEFIPVEIASNENPDANEEKEKDGKVDTEVKNPNDGEKNNDKIEEHKDNTEKLNIDGKESEQDKDPKSKLEGKTEVKGKDGEKEKEKEEKKEQTEAKQSDQEQKTQDAINDAAENQTEVKPEGESDNEAVTPTETPENDGDPEAETEPTETTEEEGDGEEESNDGSDNENEEGEEENGNENENDNSQNDVGPDVDDIDDDDEDGNGDGDDTANDGNDNSEGEEDADSTNENANEIQSAIEDAGSSEEDDDDDDVAKTLEAIEDKDGDGKKDKEENEEEENGKKTDDETDVSVENPSFEEAEEGEISNIIELEFSNTDGDAESIMENINQFSEENTCIIVEFPNEYSNDSSDASNDTDTEVANLSNSDNNENEEFSEDIFNSEAVEENNSQQDTDTTAEQISALEDGQPESNIIEVDFGGSVTDNPTEDFNDEPVDITSAIPNDDDDDANRQKPDNEPSDNPDTDTDIDPDSEVNEDIEEEVVEAVEQYIEEAAVAAAAA